MSPLIHGCLPAGEYCVRIRAFSSGATFDYTLIAGIENSGGCLPSDPPVLDGDGAFTCLAFDACPADS